MNWVIFAIISGALLGVYNLFVKLSSDKINNALGMFVIQGISAVTVLAYLLWIKGSEKQILATKEGLAIAVIAGIVIGLSALALIFNFSAGGKLTISIPIIVGLNIVVAMLLGMVVLHETVSMMEIVGLTLTLVGVILLSRG